MEKCDICLLLVFVFACVFAFFVVAVIVKWLSSVLM